MPLVHVAGAVNATHDEAGSAAALRAKRRIDALAFAPCTPYVEIVRSRVLHTLGSVDLI